MIDARNEPVSIIIAVYNEADTIGNEISKIHDKILSRLPGSELIVAEDGSTDGTKEIIAKHVRDIGIIHSTGPVRKGYAEALKDAMKIARHPWIFFSDTGNKFDFDDFWKLYAVRDQYSLVIGVRSKRTDQLYRRFLTLAYNLFLKIYFRIHLEDADSGFRIYSRELVSKLVKEAWVSTYLIGSELALRTLFSGGKIGYVPVAYRQRAGSSRGLPTQKMVSIIISVLRGMKQLKKILFSVSYPNLHR